MMISKYEDVVRMYFGNVYARSAEVSEAVKTCFDGESINMMSESGFEAEALSLAQVLAVKANNMLKDKQYQDVSVKRGSGLRIEIYGDNRWIATVNIKTDLQGNDPKGLMANKDALGNLGSYGWKGLRRLVALQKKLAS